MASKESAYGANLKAARTRFGAIPEPVSQALKCLTELHKLSVAAGDVLLLERSWYVTHSGLLRVARRNGCSSIQTEIMEALSSPPEGKWVIKATVFKTPRSKGFVSYGDADPSNVSSLVRGAEMRVAETRAVNRALRKAYGIGLCSIEELGASTRRVSPAFIAENSNNGKGQPRLRDRLLLIIRQHRLDAEQVKHYAARFCGTNSLREATREQVESFINHLASRAAEDRDKLVAEMATACDSCEVANKKGANVSGQKTEAA